MTTQPASVGGVPAASLPRPKVITDWLAVDDTGTVANYIRKLEATLAAQRELIVRADSYLSLLWHRPSQARDVDLTLNVERTIGDLRKAAAALSASPDGER